MTLSINHNQIISNFNQFRSIHLKRLTLSTNYNQTNSNFNRFQDSPNFKTLIIERRQEKNTHKLRDRCCRIHRFVRNRRTDRSSTDFSRSARRSRSHRSPAIHPPSSRVPPPREEAQSAPSSRPLSSRSWCRCLAREDSIPHGRRLVELRGCCLLPPYLERNLLDLKEKMTNRLLLRVKWFELEMVKKHLREYYLLWFKKIFLSPLRSRPI